MIQHTIAPVLVLVISCSTLLQHCQTYLYATVHWWPGTSPSDIQQSTTYTYIQKYTTDPVLVLLIRRSPLLTEWVLVLLIPFNAILPQYLPCGYDTVHYCQYQSYWYTTVHLCPSTRPALLILYSPLLPQHSPTDTLQSITTPVPDLLIQHNPLLPQYILLISYSPILSNFQSQGDVS